MSKHLFLTSITDVNVAANNRGETEGNICKLNAVEKQGGIRSVVSSEAIRYALRAELQASGKNVNRFVSDVAKGSIDYKDPLWELFDKEIYVDGDLFGYMDAKSANVDGSDDYNSIVDEINELDKMLKAEDINKDELKKLGQRKKELNKLKKDMKKGDANVRRGAAEIRCGISMSEFNGETTFNSRGGKKDSNSIYSTELHVTRYQWSAAVTPEYLKNNKHVIDFIDTVEKINHVGGNHARFLFDFSPTSIVFRWTDFPAPKIIDCFEIDEDENLCIDKLIRLIRVGDVPGEEIVIGGDIVDYLSDGDISFLKENGVVIFEGVRKAFDEIRSRVGKDLGVFVETI